MRIIKSMTMTRAGYVASMGVIRSVYGVLVGNLKGKRLLGRRRHRKEANFAVYLKEVGLNAVDQVCTSGRPLCNGIEP
jgi:hypothetical protein